MTPRNLRLLTAVVVTLLAAGAMALASTDQLSHRASTADSTTLRSASENSTPGTWQQALDTLPRGVMQLSMLSYSFQLNGTGGTLFMVFKDYSNSPSNVSGFTLDEALVSNSDISENSCGSLGPGMSCGATLEFGVGELPLPSDGSIHSLLVQLSSGGEFSFNVTAGVLEDAGCTFTSSC